MWNEKEQNDAIAQVDCKIYYKCCSNPKFINQFGSKSCICVNCQRRCRKCEEDYLKKNTQFRARYGY